MKRVILESLLGIICIVSGIYCTYSYLSSLNTANNLLLLLLSVVFTAIGVYCLYHSGKSDKTVNLKQETDTSSKKETQSSSSNSGFGNVLQKNNDLLNQWNQTNAKRDKLKMLELSGSAEESK